MTSLLNFLPAGELKHKGGGEYCGPCPRCGGTDRFVIWPEHPSGAIGGKFICRGCAPEGGDGIQFLRDFQGISFAEARSAFGLEPEQRRQAVGVPAAGAALWTPKAEKAPGKEWMDRATAFLAECSGHIKAGPGRAYLESRGLTLETARRFRLGWNPSDRYDDPVAWGLERWQNAKGNAGKIYLPAGLALPIFRKAGLVLPIFRKAGLVSLKIRCRDWQKGDSWPKYHALKGGMGGACMALGKPGLPVVVVESEIDALLIAQEAGDICAAVALGSASVRPDEKTTEFIHSAREILVSMDADAAGVKALRWWQAHFPNCKRWLPVRGKDIGEMHKAGVPVRAWIEAGQNFAAPSDTSDTSDMKNDTGKVSPIVESDPAFPFSVNMTQGLSAWLDEHCPGPTPDYAAFCSSYWRGCFDCPDHHPVNLRFCSKWNREHNQEARP